MRKHLRMIWQVSAAGVGALLFLGAAWAGEPDRLAEALDSVGFTREALGCRPKSYWSAGPNIDEVPHLPLFFKDLYAEPLRTYEFTRVMANSVEAYLAPRYRAQRENSMLYVTHFLGVDKRIAGPRGYRLTGESIPGGPAPLARAMEKMYAVGGKETTWARRRRTVEKQIEEIPPELRKPFAALLWEVAEACEWQQVAVRRIPAETRKKVFSNRSLHLSPHQQAYFPEMDDTARLIDEISLYHAAVQAVQAVETACRRFEAVLASKELDIKDLHFEFDTPLGEVVLAGTGNDRHLRRNCAVLVDLGGDDTYDGAVGSTTSLELPVSVAIDLAGNDIYRCVDPDTPSQGAGILGVGVLLDRAGNDRYEARQYAQGSGTFGLGLLWDDEGDDDYRIQYSGQGASNFGVGILVDVDGNDRYYLWGDGQGFGGQGGGIGTLADLSGNDHYVAEVDAHIAGRGDYHTRMRVPYSNAQGAGAGRRGDITDGHAWAGGLGSLIDIAGDDSYDSGNWAGGSGYWFGIGVLYDGGGNDRYRSVYFSLASGAHFSIGALFDESGDDQYLLYDPPVADDLVEGGTGMNSAGGAGLAFGWDFTLAMLFDKGGTDRYEARMISGAHAMIRSTAILADTGGGNDTYILPVGQAAGSGAFLQAYIPGTAPMLIQYGPYISYGENFGFFLDVGGKDTYLEWAHEGEHRPAGVWKDGESWWQPARDSEQFGYDCYGVGMDVETGTIPEMHRFEPR